MDYVSLKEFGYFDINNMVMDIRIIKYILQLELSKTRDKAGTRDIKNLNLFQMFQVGVSFKRFYAYIKQKHFYGQIGNLDIVAIYKYLYRKNILGS